MIETKETFLAGVQLIAKKTFADERGFFTELYSQPRYTAAGIKNAFVQDNHSFSLEGTIRGMHFQRSPGQAKLVSVLVGEIYDVFVDIRPDSPTFGQWQGVHLKSDEHHQLLIPVGFAHGFAALTDAHVLYKVDSPFDANEEKTFHFADADVGIEWPFEAPILSQKDRGASSFAEVVR